VEETVPFLGTSLAAKGTPTPADALDQIWIHPTPPPTNTFAATFAVVIVDSGSFSNSSPTAAAAATATATSAAATAAVWPGGLGVPNTRKFELLHHVESRRQVIWQQEVIIIVK
jgi:hypothetical protein